MTTRCDFIFVGGGLQNCLAILALAKFRPHARVMMFERGHEVCGNHTWSLHADDVTAELRNVIAPALVHRWDGYDVVFADGSRTVMSSYAAATSASMSAAVRAAVAARPGFTIETAAEITEVGTHHVVLRDGRRCDASWIIDARGPAHVATDVTACGYQVFVGLEIQLAAPHGLLRPILMDARLPQSAGYRFMYVLPLNEQRVLIEDTYFSDSPMFDETALVAGILRYAADRGLRVSRVVRSERGVLPLPLTLPARPARWGTHAIVAGYQGGWFHPTTGYSFPVALRVAQFLATSADQPDAATRWRRLTRDHRRQQRFAVLLNRMLFRWFPPHQRHNVFSRFYRLPLATIGRFYALRMTFGDRARMFLGRPPRGLGWRAALSGKVAV